MPERHCGMSTRTNYVWWSRLRVWTTNCRCLKRLLHFGTVHTTRAQLQLNL